MPPPSVAQLVALLLIVLAAGLAAGAVCKRIGVSLLVGYLVTGALLGAVGLHLAMGEAVHGRGQELQYLAQAGALLLLFSIGIEFSLEELRRLARFVFVGGGVQVFLVAAPVTLGGRLMGAAWGASLLVGTAAAMSSTVLVFRALEEWGETQSAHGRRAIAMLLFQDMAIVPLLLIVPMLAGADAPTLYDWLALAAKAAVFVGGVLTLRVLIGRYGVPLLIGLKSVELTVLFAVLVLGGAAMAAYQAGLPPALGALAAGILLSGNRLSAQFDALLLPYRETFAAVFFVSLGSLMRLETVWQMPWAALGGLAGVLALKTAAAAVALRLVGLRGRSAWGMGLGLAQLGEFSFVLLLEGVGQRVIPEPIYQVMLFIALGTLILTPELLKLGLRWAAAGAVAPKRALPDAAPASLGRAVVVGVGPIGAAVASQLELQGMDVCLIDRSPVNLHPFAQMGFRTVAGEATDVATLRHATVGECRLAVVTVPDDRTAIEIVALLRSLFRAGTILVRCRYQGSVAKFRRAGADAVVSEEAEAAGALLRLLSDHGAK